MTKKLAESYKKAYGFWEVTTEGDCEGRSVSRLGIYEGSGIGRPVLLFLVFSSH